VDLGDDNLGGVDTDGDGGTVGLLAVDALDVNDPLATVDLDDLALTALEGTANDHDLIILADGDGTGAVLLPELLGEGSAHDLTAKIRGSRKVGLSALAAGRANINGLLHVE